MDTCKKMNKKGQQNIVDWGVAAVILLILLYVFYKIGQAFCETDPTFCRIFSLLIAAFIFGIIWYLKFGNR